MKRVGLAIALGWMAGPLLRANDTALGDDNGTLRMVRTDGIRMVAETLDLSEREVRVAYRFRSELPSDTVLPVAFPLPVRYYGESDHTVIQGFSVEADGKPIPTVRQTYALLDDTLDVTDRLRSLGWTIPDLDGFLKSNCEADCPPPDRHRRLPKAWFRRNGSLRLSIQDRYQWSQRFPAGTDLSIRHRYRPSLTTGVPMSGVGLVEEYAKSHCLSQGENERLRSDSGQIGYRWSTLRYVVTTGNNWKEGIEDFTLRLRKSDPHSRISLCLDGPLEKISATEFVLHREKFRPASELDVLFYGRFAP